MLLPTSNGPKWFEPSDRHFHPQSPQSSQSKYLIYFTAGHRGENIKEPNDKNREKKDFYESLSVDTIIESCLILMVLLLLTCARHLIVDCTALNSPIYPVTASSRGHKEALCLPKLFSTLHSPPSPFLNCLPSVTRSVTSPVILPCVCKSWLFVLKHVNLVEGPPPPPQKKK